MDHISVGLPPAAETWYKAIGIQDPIQHPEERFPKKALAFRGHSDVTHSAFVAEQTMEYIHQHRDDPFLCIAGFYAPHSPWVAPQEIAEEVAVHARAILLADMRGRRKLYERLGMPFDATVDYEAVEAYYNQLNSSNHIRKK